MSLQINCQRVIISVHGGLQRRRSVFSYLEEFRYDVDVHTKSEEDEAYVRAIATNSGEEIVCECKKSTPCRVNSVISNVLMAFFLESSLWGGKKIVHLVEQVKLYKT